MNRHHYFRKTWVVFLLCFAAASGAYAQWTNVAPNLCAPERQYYGAIRFHNGIAWAGTTSLFYSKDSGMTWNPVPSFHIISTVAGDGGISDIAIYDSLHVLVSTWDAIGTSGGLYLTSDGGKTWNNINPTGSIQGLSGFVQVAYGSDSILYALEEASGTQLFISLDGGATWRGTTTNNTVLSVPLCFAIAADKTLNVFSISESLNSMGLGWFNKSSDTGKTWSGNSGTTDGDCNTLSADSCDANRLYLVNENTVLKSGNQSRIDLTTDAGTTWQTSSSEPLDYFNGSLSSTKNVIYAGAAPKEGTIATTGIGVDRSTDKGMTWKNIGGPLESFDTRTIAAVNDNIVLVLDTGGSVWRTLNSGGNPLPNPASASPAALFQVDTVFCDSLSRSVQFSRWGCSPPSVSSYSIIGADSGSFEASNLSFDSILVTLRGIKQGNQNAQLVLMLDDGSRDTVSLAGYVASAPNALSLSTSDVKTDTLDATVAVPITFNGLEHSEDVDLILHYEGSVDYLGSFSPLGAKLDVPGEQWPGRSLLHIPGATPGVVAGYAKFNVFNDSNEGAHATFDSLNVLTAISPCEYGLPKAATSRISAPSGCGTTMFSQFMKSGRITFGIQSVVPNPASGVAQVTFINPTGSQFSYAVLDALGQTREHAATAGNTLSLDVSRLVPGVYFIRATGEDGVSVSRQFIILR